MTRRVACEVEVERIIRLLQPPRVARIHGDLPAHLANYRSTGAGVPDCREAVLDAIERIPTSNVTVREKKRQLLLVAAKLRSARSALDAAWMPKEALVREIDRGILWCEKTSSELKVKRSGGPGGMLVAEQQRTAARYAFYLLHEFGRVAPSLTKDGPYFEIAGILYEVATGRRSGDMSRICTRVWKDLKDEGYFDASDLEQWRCNRRFWWMPE